MPMNARHAREPQHRVTSIEKPELLEASTFRRRVDAVARCSLQLTGAIILPTSIVQVALPPLAEPLIEDIKDKQLASELTQVNEVAVVNFALPDSEAEIYAAMLEDRVNETGDGLIRIDTQVVTPSDVAIETY